jgi:hypothetical protein
MLLKASISASESSSHRILEAGFCIYVITLCKFQALSVFLEVHSAYLEGQFLRLKDWVEVPFIGFTRLFFGSREHGFACSQTKTEL